MIGGQGRDHGLFQERVHPRAFAAGNWRADEGDVQALGPNAGDQVAGAAFLEHQGDAGIALAAKPDDARQERVKGRRAGEA